MGNGNIMYYLDLFGLYKPTTKEQRLAERRRLDRDAVMENRLKRQHYQCFYCADEVSMADHLDHIIPIYYGGASGNANLVAACKKCNLAKSCDQIEITNQYTINDYLRLQKTYSKWQKRVKANPSLKRYAPKRVRLYHTYSANLFKCV